MIETLAQQLHRLCTSKEISKGNKKVIVSLRMDRHVFRGKETQAFVDHAGDKAVTLIEFHYQRNTWTPEKVVNILVRDEDHLQDIADAIDMLRNDDFDNWQEIISDNT